MGDSGVGRRERVYRDLPTGCDLFLISDWGCSGRFIEGPHAAESGLTTVVADGYLALADGTRIAEFPVAGA